jgi:hypothetical protein
MGTYFTPEPKIKRAPTKIVVSVWMPQITTIKRDILWLHREGMGTGLWTHLKISLFWCQWVKLTGGGVTKDQCGMIIVDLNNLEQSWVHR